MKLYTEEQVLNALKLAHSHIKPLQYVVDNLTPIELPSDEEILNESDEFELKSRVSLGMHQSFEIGARWMRDKIKGGNK